MVPNLSGLVDQWEGRGGDDSLCEWQVCVEAPTAHANRASCECLPLTQVELHVYTYLLLMHPNSEQAMVVGRWLGTPWSKP